MLSSTPALNCSTANGSRENALDHVLCSTVAALGWPPTEDRQFSIDGHASSGSQSSAHVRHHNCHTQSLSLSQTGAPSPHSSQRHFGQYSAMSLVNAEPKRGTNTTNGPTVTAMAARVLRMVQTNITLMYMLKPGTNKALRLLPFLSLAPTKHSLVTCLCLVQKHNTFTYSPRAGNNKAFQIRRFRVS